jgi:hypothetical protein
MKMDDIHKFQSTENKIGRGTTAYDIKHTTVCGYVRDNVTINNTKVTCRVCQYEIAKATTDGIYRLID